MSEGEDNPKRKIDLIVQTGFINWDQPLAFSPDGKILACGGLKSISLWDMAGGVELGRLCPHEGGKILFSPNGEYLVTSGGKQGPPIRLWHLASRQEVTTLKLDNTIRTDKFDFVFDRNGKLLVGEGREEKVKIWDVVSGQETNILTGHSAMVKGVKFSLDGKFLVSIDEDQIIKIWDTPTGRELRSFSNRPSSFNLFTLSPDGNILAIWCREKKESLKYWDVVTGREIFPRFTLRNEVKVSDAEGRLNIFSPDGKNIVIKEAGQEAVSFWSPAQFPIIFSPDRKVLAFRDSETISLWDVVTKETIKTLRGHMSKIIAAAFSQDGKILALGGETSIKLWNLETRQELKTLPDSGAGLLAFSPDGRLLASGNGERIINLWDLATGQRLRRFRRIPLCFSHLEFNDDGKTLAGGSRTEDILTGERQDYVVIWDVATSEVLEDGASQERVLNDFPTLFKPTDKTVSGRFSARVKDGTVKLLDRETEQELATLMVFSENDWLVTTPEKLFDGTPPAIKQIIWRLDDNIFNYRPVEAFYERFFHPGLLPNIFAGNLPST